VPQGKNLKRGGVPTLSLLRRNHRPECRKTLWKRRTSKGEGQFTLFQGIQEKTLKRKKAKRGANVRSG
jgi:hypothetical protein